MPLDLGHYPSISPPTLGLIIQINDPEGTAEIMADTDPLPWYEMVIKKEMSLEVGADIEQ
jgi:hypothetical protein